MRDNYGDLTDYPTGTTCSQQVTKYKCTEHNWTGNTTTHSVNGYVECEHGKVGPHYY